MTEQSKQNLDEAFEHWWYNEGSGIIPLPGDDCEAHAYRVARIAWHNGAYVATEASCSALQQDPYKLSPAAQAVLGAYNQDPFANTKQSLAVVLRAIELKLAYMNDYGDYLIDADMLVAIANELEGAGTCCS